MPKPAPIEQPEEPLTQESLTIHIGRQVIRALGTPKDLLKVKVHPVGGDTYRVNIMTGKDFATGRIAHSFFLTADAAGNIEHSTPKLVKLH